LNVLNQFRELIDVISYVLAIGKIEEPTGRGRIPIPGRRRRVLLKRSNPLGPRVPLG